MSNKLKALAVAAVLSVSASANAAIDTFNGDSEFYFNAWDINTGKGYTLDLDWANSFEDFVGADQAIGAAGNAAVLAQADLTGSSLIGAGGIIYDGALTGFDGQFATTDNVQWTFGAYDNVGRGRLLTTVNNTVGALSSTDVKTDQVKQAAALQGVQNVNSNAFVAAGTNGDLAIDTYALTSQTDGAAYAGNLGANFGGQFVGGDVTNAMGDTSDIYFYAGAGTNARDPLFKTSLVKQLQADGLDVFAKTYQDNGEWRLQLAVAAVPEPQTYAMLLAGLGVMGASARRRIK